MRHAILAIAGLLIVPTLPGLASPLDSPADGVVARLYLPSGELVYEVGVEPADPSIGFVRHYLPATTLAAKPGGGGPDPGTDCESDAYKLTGWKWTSPYSAKAAQYASQANSAANTWDAATGASISGGITSGKSGNAGTYDGVNQLEWMSLGASSTVAVTTTWYYRQTGVAVESDGQYNTYYAWATNGDPNAMDVLSVATHEIGHTFGLNHPTSTSANSCLTMYAYVDYGWTHQRTLGDGDILGIRAIYGA